MPLIRTIRLNPNRMFVHLVLVFVSFMLTILLLTRLPDKPKQYTYSAVQASNGVKLHTIVTRPDNIGLKAVSSNLSRLPDYGINGGFFWEGQLLSLAVINDRPVRGNQGEYGSGWYNIDRPRGTLVWDEARKVFSIQVVESAEELIVADRTRYWAQGGVSMGLRNEARWAAQAVSEEMPVIDERRMRSGIAYDTANNVYLVVAPTPAPAPNSGTLSGSGSEKTGSWTESSSTATGRPSCGWPRPCFRETTGKCTR
ncbi:hypothetical protein N6H14_08365 [Paenibacillus sp. CC-CFT747]|nr:hypothetical protein N6H14_08365 [Paenibacillus sp. CC-CFT747]